MKNETTPLVGDDDKPTNDPLRNLYDFVFGDPEDVFTMPIEQVNEELREAGIDPDEIQRRVRDRLAELGVHLPEPSTGRSTSRREGNKLAKGDTRFEDWP